jgi:hypothetical protein
MSIFAEAGVLREAWRGKAGAADNEEPAYQ